MQYEYKQVTWEGLIPREDLDLYGKEEWELVSVVPYKQFFAYYFVRPKVTEEILQKI